MNKYRITFSYNYEDVDYDWDESISGTTTHFDYSEAVIVDKDITLTELLELKKKAEMESFGKIDVYTDIQIEVASGEE